MDSRRKLKVAIVHDWLVGLGGGERVVYSLTKLFPQADIYTSVYEPRKLPFLKDKTVYTSFLQHWPLAKTKHQLFARLRPLAFESFDFSGYNLVISSSSAESKGIITPTETLHISYIHTPVRYYWSGYREYLANPGFGVLNPLVKIIMPHWVKKLRYWDYAAAQRPDFLIANSKVVSDRIRKYYQRKSQIIFPPVNIERFIDKPTREGDYYLIVSRFIPYKKIDIAIQACNSLNRKLIIAGRGPEEKYLKKIAGPSIEFMINPNDDTVNRLYLGCKAFLFPGHEDFGITPIEAYAAGKPTIFYNEGGVSETAVDEITGLSFDKQTPQNLAEAITKFEKLKFNSKVIRDHAKKFSETRFLKEMEGYIEEKLAEKKLI